MTNFGFLLSSPDFASFVEVAVPSTKASPMRGGGA